MNGKQRERYARHTIRAALASLPAPLRERAEMFPVSLARRPTPAMVAEGVPPDTLGLFVGEAFTEEGNTLHPLPAQVILFTDNLWDEADGQLYSFRDEIRITLLHELGHFLGLDEPDLDERGLG